jgi:hypothetical protein
MSAGSASWRAQTSPRKWPKEVIRGSPGPIPENSPRPIVKSSPASPHHTKRALSHSWTQSRHSRRGTGRWYRALAPCVRHLPQRVFACGGWLKPEHLFDPVQHQIAIEESEHGLFLRDRITAGDDCSDDFSGPSNRSLPKSTLSVSPTVSIFVPFAPVNESGQRILSSQDAPAAVSGIADRSRAAQPAHERRRGRRAAGRKDARQHVRSARRHDDISHEIQRLSHT